MKSSIVLIVCFGLALSSAYPDNQQAKREADRSRIVAAIQRGDAKAVNEMLNDPNFPSFDIVRADPGTGDTLLNLAVAQGNIETVKILAGYADVNQKGRFLDGKRLTAMDTAANNDRLEIYDFLRHKGAQNPFRGSELKWAAETGFASLVKRLIEQKMNVNEIVDTNSTTLLHHIVGLKPAVTYVPIAKLLIENKADVNARDANGRTPIYCTAKKGLAEMTKLLIDHDAAVNIVDYKKKSPLHEAIEQKAADVAIVLINHKANLNETTRFGETALHIFAKNSKNKNLAKALIENGIDLNVRDAWNKTAADYIEDKPENAELIEILTGNDALTLCANIILISFVMIGTMIVDRVQ